MGVTLREITEQNRAAVLALRVPPEQKRFVGSVQDALDDAAEYPQAERGTERSTPARNPSAS